MAVYNERLGSQLLLALHVQSQDVQVAPEGSVPRGHNIAINITAQLSAAHAAVGAAQLSATVKYLGIKVYTTSNDLCNKIACPVLPGSTINLM